jgi:hypothetical protein
MIDLAVPVVLAASKSYVMNLPSDQDFKRGCVGVVRVITMTYQYFTSDQYFERGQLVFLFA